MNQEHERTLRNLGVIAALTQNDKINTKEDIFVIYVPTVLRGVTRFAYGESRDQNITRILSCIRDSKAYISSSISELSIIEDGDLTVLKRMTKETQHQHCSRMLTALEKSQCGLRALQITYKEDASCITQLNILLHEIEDFIATTRQVAQSCPELQRFA